jgi:hypothetical protein
VCRNNQTGKRRNAGIESTRHAIDSMELGRNFKLPIFKTIPSSCCQSIACCRILKLTFTTAFNKLCEGRGVSSNRTKLMKQENLRCHLAVCGAVSWLLLAGGMDLASADVFTINPAQSSLTISGSILEYGFAQQGAGSLTTAYNGTIRATQSGGTIQFTGQSVITAQTNGSWQPLAGGGSGNAPADYGAQISIPFVGTGYAALRSILLDVTSPPIPVSSGQFSASSLTFLFPTNATSAIDYHSAVGSGTKVATGNATNNVATLATLTTAGSTQTLTLDINAQFTFTLVSANDTIVNLAGQFVATRNVAPTQVVLQSPAVTNHVVTLTWQSSSGQFFQVLTSTNLTAWQTNASNVTSATTNYTWTGTNPAPDGFYRLAQ